MKAIFGTALAAALVFASAATAQTPPSNVASVPYRVVAGDDLEIFVWGEERLQRTVRVLPDGSFSFPLVGKVAAAGLLPNEIEARISKGLEPQYRGAVPQVTVSVKSATGTQFSIIGKVRSPGTFTPGRYINALEAVTLAGGPAEFAEMNNVTILRRSGANTQSIRVRLGDVLKGSSSAANANIPAIQGGDTVVVP
jgi:polysaccharide export outer membrane protein